MTRKRLIALLYILSALLVVMVALLVALEMRSGEAEDTRPTTGNSVQLEASDPESGGDPSGGGETASSPTDNEETTPGETAGGAESKPGYDASGSGNQNSGTSDTEDRQNTLSNELTCSNYSLFSGQYVEDSRDEMVENVAAMLVTNNTDRYLDIGMLYYSIDGEDAMFIVTGLPAGESAWVMEATQLTVTGDSEFKLLDSVSAFRDGVVSETGDVTVTADGNMLTATNNTARTLDSVCVYYKTLHTDGNYFGGITYMVDFGTLAPGESAEVLAGHYSEASQIVRIGWLESGGT